MPTMGGRCKRDVCIDALLFFAWINDGMRIETLLASRSKSGASRRKELQPCATAHALDQAGDIERARGQRVVPDVRNDPQ